MSGMRGFRSFLVKELTEVFRTWRGPLFFGFALFFAVSSPVLAKLTPQLLASIGTGQPGLEIHIPDPTWHDAVAQWIKNLSQLLTLLVLVSGGGLIAGEVAAGTTALVLTKPVPRFAFVSAKVIAQCTAVVSAVVVGTALEQGVTRLVFGTSPGADLWRATGAWIAWAVMLVALVAVFSARFTALAAGGLSVGAFVALSVLSAWGPAARYSPAGLLGIPARIASGEQVATAWPVATALLACVVLTALSGWLFARREL